MFETFHVCVCVTSIKLSVNSAAVSTLLTAKALTAGAVAVAAGAEDSAGAVAVAAGAEDSAGAVAVAAGAEDSAGAVAVAAGVEDSAGAVAVAAGVEDSTGVIVGETMLIAKRFEPLLPTWLSLPVPVIVTL